MYSRHFWIFVCGVDVHELSKNAMHKGHLGNTDNNKTFKQTVGVGETGWGKFWDQKRIKSSQVTVWLTSTGRYNASFPVLVQNRKIHRFFVF